ncbi:MAG: DUF86 domain-containing protein [Flavobacteriaceae bacterium]|nr:DUF86 domain-containing protein [Flavobacteriaceae bacterium]
MEREKKEMILSYIDRIGQAIEKTHRFVHDLSSFEEFQQNLEKQSAVKYELLVGSESIQSITKIDPNIEKEYPVIPWSEIIGFRVALTHYHFKINLETVWETAIKESYQLQNQLASLQNHVLYYDKRLLQSRKNPNIPR